MEHIFSSKGTLNWILDKNMSDVNLKEDDDKESVVAKSYFDLAFT